jgi:hypothetical protein
VQSSLNRPYCTRGCCIFRLTGLILVLSQFNYCNSLFANLPARCGTTPRLQMLINAAPQVISSRSRFHSITDYLQDKLHAGFRFLNESSSKSARKALPPYLSAFYKPTSSMSHHRVLRSSTRQNMIVPPYSCNKETQCFALALN